MSSLFFLVFDNFKQSWTIFVKFDTDLWWILLAWYFVLAAIFPSFDEASQLFTGAEGFVSSLISNRLNAELYSDCQAPERNRAFRNKIFHIIIKQPNRANALHSIQIFSPERKPVWVCGVSGVMLKVVGWCWYQWQTRVCELPLKENFIPGKNYLCFPSILNF